MMNINLDQWAFSAKIACLPAVVGTFPKTSISVSYSIFQNVELSKQENEQFRW